MNPETMTMAQQMLYTIFGALLTVGGLKTMWEVAHFAISARSDINKLAEAFSRFEANIDKRIDGLEHRMTALEEDKAVRKALAAQEHNA